MSMRTLEKDIESQFIDWAIEYKGHHEAFQKNYQYLGRQVKLPLGIADVILLNNDMDRHGIDVVEIKRQNATPETLAQVMGYVGQVEEILYFFCNKGNSPWSLGPNGYWGKTKPVIVAPGLEGDFMLRCFKSDIFEFIRIKETNGIIEFHKMCGWEYALINDKPNLERIDAYRQCVDTIRPAFETLLDFRFHVEE